VQPDKDRSAVLVSYADGRGTPALLERRFERPQGRPGRVLLFTTPLDRRDKPWTSYLESLSSFYVALANLSTAYLAGDTEAAQLNFLSGHASPVLAVPAALRAPAYTLRGPQGLVESVPAGENQGELRFKQAVQPGNYTLEDDTRQVGGFSVNLPPEEGNLARVPVADIESLFGPGAVVPLERRTPLREALQGHWGQPLELFPLLMVLLLLLLAVENLLANKFYRREPEAQA
jgi:hypothetical protein